MSKVLLSVLLALIAFSMMNIHIRANPFSMVSGGLWLTSGIWLVLSLKQLKARVDWRMHHKDRKMD